MEVKITSITPLGSGIYSVVSSPHEKHTVDLRALSGNGACTCATFTDCCAFLIQQQRGAKRWRCDHILAVRLWVLEHEYPTLIERTEKIIEMPTAYDATASLPDSGS